MSPTPKSDLAETSVESLETKKRKANEEADRLAAKGKGSKTHEHEHEGKHHYRRNSWQETNLLQKICDELSFSGIKKHFLDFWSALPIHVWAFFVNSLYVPAYRREWKRYRTWNYDIHGKGKPHDFENISQTGSHKQRKSDLANSAEKHEGCQRLRFNVSGEMFETQWRTLSRFPTTLLGNPDALVRYWDPRKQEFFLDRHAACFESILHYYQTGGVRLERPNGIPLHVFEDEVKFYELGHKEMNRMLDEEGFMLETERDVPNHPLQRKIWLLLDNQDSSKQARLVSFISIFTITISTVILCLETLNVFEPREGVEAFVIDRFDAIFIAETICVTFFTLEFLLRFGSSPNKAEFVRGLMNIIDFMAVLPYFLQIAVAFSGSLVVATSRSFTNYILIRKGTKLDALFRILKVVRAFRILKFSRFSKGLRILGLTLRASLQELGLLCFFLAVGVILFSSALYFAENGEGSAYTSIPFTFYWGVSTMTTLGYGTHVPKTTIGRIIGSLCALSGVLTLSLPVPVIVANFNYFYHRETDDLRPRMAHADAYVRSCPFLPTCHQDDNEGEDEDKAKEFRLPGEKELLNFSSVDSDDDELMNNSIDSLEEMEMPKGTGPVHRQKESIVSTMTVIEPIERPVAKSITEELLHQHRQ